MTHYLSLSEVAEVLGISERTTYRWIKAGKLRAYKPGRDYRIPKQAIREAIEGGGPVGESEAMLHEANRRAHGLAREVVRLGEQSPLFEDYPSLYPFFQAYLEAERRQQMEATR